MIRLSFMLLLIVIVSLTAQNTDKVPLMLASLKGRFDLGNPVLVVPNLTLQERESWIKIMHGMASIGLEINFVNLNVVQSIHRNFVAPAMIFIAEQKQEFRDILDLMASEGFGKKRPIYVFTQSNIRNVSFRHIKIDQTVYITDLTTNEMAEVYTVNGISVRNSIGHFSSNGSQFNMNRYWSSQTREDLEGTNLIALTNLAKPYSTLDPEYLTKARFFESNQTFDVSDFVSGLYFDILAEMSEDLNFTFAVYKRSDPVWGTVNSVGKPTGMLSQLADGSADMVMSAYGMNNIRLPYCDHLPILSPFVPAIVIKKNFHEKYNMNTFIEPWSPDIWKIMLLFDILFAIWLFIMTTDRAANNVPVKVRFFFGWFYSSSTAKFGGSPINDIENKRMSSRIILFICLMSGVVLWMGYQASLTSKLATHVVALPFDSLETLLETGFELGTYIEGSTQADLFMVANEGTVYNRLYKTKMQSGDSFVENSFGLGKVLEKQQYAYFNYYNMILADRDYDCKISFVWKSPVAPVLASFAMSKNSTFLPILSRKLLSMIENGRIATLNAKHLIQEPNCTPLLKEATPLSIQKLIALFLLVGFGVLLALIILAIEKVSTQNRDLKLADNAGDFEMLQDEELRSAFTIILRKLDRMENKQLQKSYKRMPLQNVLDNFKANRKLNSLN